MRFNLLIYISVLLLMVSCSSCTKPENGTDDAVPTKAPELSGMLLWTVGEKDGDSNLWIHDFKSDKTVCLSDTWSIFNPCEGSFSPDGSKIVFSARKDGKWNLYCYDITSGKLPSAILPADGTNRYPQYLKDGRIIFSQDGKVATVGPSDGQVQIICADVGNHDYPIMNEAGDRVVFSQGVGDGSSIGLYRVAKKTTSLLYDKDGVADIMTVPGHGDSFYYVSEYSSAKPIKQVWVGDFNAGQNKRLPFNSVDGEYTSPAKAISGWLFVSTTDGNTLSGSHDIVLAHEKSGKKFSMAEYSLSINTASDEFPCSYRESSVAIAQPQKGEGREGSSGNQGGSTGEDISSDTKLPALKGRMVYHNYTSYNSMDSRMYIYDFAYDTKTEISKNWANVTNPMNGHFSPDGKYITFMGIGAAGNWDIFLYEVGSSALPTNLTSAGGSWRDEDPKFSYDGKKIAFKRDDRLAEIVVSTKKITVLSDNPSSEPYSMPYYTTDGKNLLYGGGPGSEAYIGLFNLATAKAGKLYDRAGVVEYYPITIDADSFYYSAHVSASDNHDQLWKGYFDGRAAQYLAFNKTSADYSDACPIGSGWLFLVSTRSGGKGGYDLYIGHETSGAIYSLSNYNSSINTNLNELGASYTTAR